jgi:hypothetical protein
VQPGSGYAAGSTIIALLGSSPVIASHRIASHRSIASVIIIEVITADMYL